MARKSKVRQYAFGASNSATREHGTFFLTAKNLDAAEDIRWNVIDGRGTEARPDPAFAHIECAGYVGPMSGSTWVFPEDVRGFVSDDVLRDERLATLPEVEHDPALLAEFIEQRGRRPERGASLGRNLLNPNGGVIEVSHGTPSYCDPRSEAYHSM